MLHCWLKQKEVLKNILIEIIETGWDRTSTRRTTRTDFIRKISIKFWKIITCKQDNLKDCQWKQNLTVFVSKMHKIYLRKNQSMKGQYCDNRPINDHEFDVSFLHYHLYTTNSLEIFKLITMSQRWPTKLFQDIGQFLSILAMIG